MQCLRRHSFASAMRFLRPLRTARPGDEKLHFTIIAVADVERRRASTQDTPNILMHQRIIVSQEERNREKKDFIKTKTIFGSVVSARSPRHGTSVGVNAAELIRSGKVKISSSKRMK